MRRLDLKNSKFGRLTAIKPCGINKCRQIIWLCRCDCSRRVKVVGAFLNSGHTKSCGCLQKEKTKRNAIKATAARIRHGKSYSPTYKIWLGMRNRCVSRKNYYYKNYGGRGIKVCKRWLKFENFLSDMGPRPSEWHQIDRYPNNNGDYKPTNCRWATPLENSNNKRNNIFVTYKGQKKTIGQWCVKTGMRHSVLKYRIFQAKWTVKDAIETPVSHSNSWRVR